MTRRELLSDSGDEKKLIVLRQVFLVPKYFKTQRKERDKKRKKRKKRKNSGTLRIRAGNAKCKRCDHSPIISYRYPRNPLLLVIAVLHHYF
jgi:hypothetical protein